jgi:hypothetical protein
MGKIAFIIGQLVVEIKGERISTQGNRSVFGHTTIVPGGRSYRQAEYALQQGYGVILLGRVGDDHNGRVILQSLAKLGISTQFIQISAEEYTGLSLSVSDAANGSPQEFFDPGANMGEGDFEAPIRDYLSLCDVVVMNQWINSGHCDTVRKVAESNSIPTIYVCTFPPHEIRTPVEYLLLDVSKHSAMPTDLDRLSARRGVFLWRDGAFSAYRPDGTLCYSLELDPQWDSDYLVTRLMGSLSRTTQLEETESFARLPITRRASAT